MVTEDRPAEWDPSPSAPEGLEVVRRFVNTLDCYRQRDGLTDVRAARRAFRYAELPEADEIARTLDPPSLAVLRQARAAMRAVLGCTTLWDVKAMAGTGEKDNAQALEWSVGVRLGVGAGGVLFTRSQGTVESALSGMTLELLFAERTGSITRLKVCANPGCQWAFWDSSRPGSARWCSMRVCGGQAKSRRYRARSAAGDVGG